jgi:hypothetical protein
VPDITLRQDQYESLISLARQGVESNPDDVRRLEEFLTDIETTNGITRSIVWVRWQELDAPLPAGTSFPDTWPPEWQRKIELITRPVARADVDRVITVHANNPLSIMCSRDPAGVLGWTAVDDFFTN